MKKVLFVTYFWAPSGKATVHWPLHIIKYLPDYNWQPLVLAAEEDMFSSTDKSLLKDVNPGLTVVRTKSWDPFNLYRKFIGKKKNESITASETISQTNKSITHRVSIWIRMNLFVPDARAGWYFPGTKSGNKLLREEKIDAIVSVGPPHTGHLIAKKLSKKFSIPHIPVFIDPWVDIVYYKNFKRSRPTLALDNYFEKSVLKNAASVVFVTATMRNDYVRKYDFLKNKSHVLYWGFNENNFADLPAVGSSGNEVIVHAGNIFDYQNIPAFWNYIKKEINKGRKIKIKFIGSVSPGIRMSIKNIGLENHTEYLGFLPYDEMINQLNNATYLLVCTTEKRHVPGKLFEYLRIGKPIIAFGDDNREVGEIIRSANAGMIFRYDEDASAFFNPQNKFKTKEIKIKNFDRKQIAFSLSKILDTYS